jgi:hypothetical protein
MNSGLSSVLRIPGDSLQVLWGFALLRDRKLIEVIVTEMN